MGPLLNPADSTRRYRQLVAEVQAQPGWRVLRTGLATAAVPPAFARAEIFLGSHVDEDPSTEDRVEVWSYRPYPPGGEEILQEVFVQRQERRGLFSTRPVLHHCAFLIRSPGGACLDAALASIDLDSGEVFRSLNGPEAGRRIEGMGLTQDAGQHNPPPAAHHPRPAPPPRDEARQEVERLAEGLHRPASRIEVGPEEVVVGEVRLERRR
jgi:hypothetical protein